MPSILDYLNTISDARYGRDVRQAIVDAISACYQDGKAGVSDLEARRLIESAIGVNESQQADIDTLYAQIADIQGGGDSSQESTTITLDTVIYDGGFVDSVTVNNNATKTYDVTFTQTFTEVPEVFACVAVQNSAAASYSKVTVGIVKAQTTKTGFRFFIANTSGATRSTTVVWAAFQPTTKEIDLDITIPSGDGMSEADVRAITNPIQTSLNGIKTGYDGTMYSTPGEAVREQINDLHVLIGDEPGTAIQGGSVSYDGTESGLTATTVQAAIDENAANLSNTNERLDELEKSAGGILYEQSGTSIEVNLSDTLDGIKYLTVVGKTEQEGTPDIDNPADIIGLGELDSTTGTYTVTVPVTDSGGVVHNIVATGLTYPLYDGDTLDLVTGEIDRKNGQIIFDGTQEPRATSARFFDVIPRCQDYATALTNRLTYSGSEVTNTFGGNSSTTKPNYIIFRLGTSVKSEILQILTEKPVQLVYKLHDVVLPYTEQVTVTGIDAVNELTGVVTINSETMLTAKWDIDGKSYIDNADSALDSRVSTNENDISQLADGSYPVAQLGEFVLGSWWGFNDKHTTPTSKCMCAEKLTLPVDAFLKCDIGYKIDLYTASQTVTNNVHAVVKAGETFVLNVSEIAVNPPTITNPMEVASHCRIYTPITSEYNRLYESFAGFEMFNSVGFIGDSYTVHAPNGITWGKVIERRLGIDVGVYGQSGKTSSYFIRGGLLDEMLSDTLRELYWIEFVINDASRYDDDHSYLGSESDVSGEDYTAYPDTLWGNYGHIIEAILAAKPTAKIVLCKGTFANLRTAQIDTGVTDIPVVNAELDDIGAHYGVPVVNPLDDMFYWSMIFTGSMSSNHPKALGMPGIASAKMRMFSRCVQDNIDYFYA